MATELDMKTVFVECSPSDGMFDTEVAVAIDTVDGLISLFADRSLVHETPERAELRTYAVVSGVVGSGPIRLLLPSEAFETGTRWIRVSPAKVRIDG